MEIKAIFFDIDGTIYDHIDGLGILPESLKALHLLQKNGYKVCLCSGRSKKMAAQLGVFDLFPWDGYIGGAGVSVYDEHLNVLHEEFFTQQQTEEIFKVAKTHAINLFSQGVHEFMTLPLDEPSAEAIKIFGCPIPEVRDWNREVLVALCAFKERGYHWDIFHHIEGIHLYESYDTCVDFLKDGVDKAKGIHRIMEHWGFDKHAFIGFGDSLNDIEMIQEASIGVVMGNGKPILKTYADKICGTSNTPAISIALKELGLI